MEMVIGKKIAHGSSNGLLRAAGIGGLALTGVWLLLAQAFAFEVASPVAAQDYKLKAANFVFRTTGCADPGKVQVSALGEGIVDGARRSVQMTVHASSKPGAWAIQRQWDAGRWVVVLKGACGELQAGAIVPVREYGFIREAVKLYSHAPAPGEVDAALKALQ